MTKKEAIKMAKRIVAKYEKEGLLVDMLLWDDIIKALTK